MVERSAGLERLLASGQDSALLRFSLGGAYLETNPALAAIHLNVAVSLDPGYAAAWKLLGKALLAAGDIPSAREAYLAGIAAAEAHGHIQAAKEMRVFLKRLDA